jgi:GNAT superfamily N-acetyltransferase
MKTKTIRMIKKNEMIPVIIRPIRRSDIAVLVDLHLQFEAFLRILDPKRRHEAAGAFANRLKREGFGRNRAFCGYLATSQKRPVGYIFYHYGYDPDEMRGRVVYVIDLYVTNNIRNARIGSRLMEAVASNCRRVGGIDIYFGVWDRNKAAIAFYERIGARHNSEIMLYHWTKASWNIKTGRKDYSLKRVAHG